MPVGCSGLAAHSDSSSAENGKREDPLSFELVCFFFRNFIINLKGSEGWRGKLKVNYKKRLLFYQYF